MTEREEVLKYDLTIPEQDVKRMIAESYDLIVGKKAAGFLGGSKQMKRSRLSYDEWKCILEKKQQIKKVENDTLAGHVALLEIEKVTVPQIWKFNGEDIVVCQKGYRWLSILPQNDFYCITAMMDENDKILLWYIDMIAAQGIDSDGVPYFDDLYLDLVVYPDGTILEDDRDELEEALAKGDITEEQFALADRTCRSLKGKNISWKD